MKILYHHRIASKDGQYIHLSAIVRELTKLGHDVILCGPNIAEAGQMGGGKVWVDWLKRTIPQAIYELIECGYNLYDFMRLAVVILKHQPDVIYERHNLYFVSGIWAQKIFRRPLLLEVNAPLYQERKQFNTIALDRLAQWSEHYVWKNADCVLPVTKVLAGIIKSEVRPKALEVIHNGVSLDELVVTSSAEEMRRQYGLTNQIILGFVGFVRDWHRLELIIDYISRRPTMSLVLMIVGEGPDCERLIQYAKDCGVESQLIMAGVVQRQQMANHINVFDVALQSAVTAYASPLKLFEYLALGKVVVAPDMPNIREIVSDNHNGILFDVDSLSSLNHALDGALDEERQRVLSTAARETIMKQKFLWSDNANRIEALFNRL